MRRPSPALVVALVFAAELGSGLGLMLLDILAGSILAGLVPLPVRSRVSRAFQLVNYGVRPVGTTLGGVLGSTIGWTFAWAYRSLNRSLGGRPDP